MILCCIMNWYIVIYHGTYLEFLYIITTITISIQGLQDLVRGLKSQISLGEVGAFWYLVYNIHYSHGCTHTDIYIYMSLYVYISWYRFAHTHLFKFNALLYIYISTYNIYIHMFQVHGPPSLSFPLVLCAMVGGWISPFFCGTAGHHFQKC